MSKVCVLQGPFNTVSGYGAHARDIARSFIKGHSDWEVKLIDVRWGNTPRNYLMEKRDGDLISRLLTEPLQKQPELYIPILVPNEFRPMGKYNIGITAGIETTECDPAWVEGMNRMQMNIVPSNHAKEIFEKANFQGIDKRTNQVVGSLTCSSPIEVLFEGVDTNIYKQTDTIAKSVDNIMKEVKEDFSFLFMGHWLQGGLGHDRKDIGMLIKVFCSTFKNMPKKPALVIKTSGSSFSVMDREDILKKINIIRNNDELPNVYLVHGDMTDVEINSLYNHPKIKAMVSFTHGEGYGRPLAEFCTSKKPVIAPNWSGQIDFLHKDYCSLLPGELKNVDRSALQKNMINEGSQWFYVNYFYASQVLKDVYKNYKSHKKKAVKQGEHILKHFTLDKMAEKLKRIVDEKDNIKTGEDSDFVIL